MGSSDPIPEIPGYTVGALLGQGGMGRVYRARQDGLKRNVALKVLLSPRDVAFEHLRRFRQEITLSTRLIHPNLVRVYDAGVVGETLYLAMELVEGPTLKTALERHTGDRTGYFLKVFPGLLSAVLYLHENGVIHRDIKPSNILMESIHQAKLADLGLARSAGQTRLTTEKVFVGTVLYTAPEVLAGDEATLLSDGYSLGLVGYEILSGRLPHAAGSLPEWLARITLNDPTPILALCPTLDPRLAGFVMSLLAREPGDRLRLPDAPGILEGILLHPPRIRPPRSVIYPITSSRTSGSSAGSALSGAEGMPEESIPGSLMGPERTRRLPAPVYPVALLIPLLAGFLYSFTSQEPQAGSRDPASRVSHQITSSAGFLQARDRLLEVFSRRMVLEGQPCTSFDRTSGRADGPGPMTYLEQLIREQDPGRDSSGRSCYFLVPEVEGIAAARFELADQVPAVAGFQLNGAPLEVLAPAAPVSLALPRTLLKTGLNRLTWEVRARPPGRTVPRISIRYASGHPRSPPGSKDDLPSAERPVISRIARLILDGHLKRSVTLAQALRARHPDLYAPRKILGSTKVRTAWIRSVFKRAGQDLLFEMSQNLDDGDTGGVRGPEESLEATWASGVSLLSSVLEDHPDDPEAWHALGLAFFMIGERPVGTRALERSCLLDPDSHVPWHRRAEILLLKRSIAGVPREDLLEILEADQIAMELVRSQKRDDDARDVNQTLSWLRSEIAFARGASPDVRGR